MTQNIVVAYDGSDHSERALDWAIAESQQRQLPVKIVLSTGRQTGLDQSIYGAFADALHQESERLATRAVEKAKAGGAPRALEVGDAAAPALGAAMVQLTSDAARTDAHRFYERLGYVATHEGFTPEV